MSKEALFAIGTILFALYLRYGAWWAVVAIIFYGGYDMYRAWHRPVSTSKRASDAVTEARRKPVQW